MAPANRPPGDRPPKAGAIRFGAGWTATQLRRQAEELALKTAAVSRDNDKVLTPETTRLMLHELHVHQIELEMQNEELRRTQLALEAARQRYFDLYDLAPVGYCSVSDRGLVLQANLAAATMLGVSRSAVADRPISAFIFPVDQDIYYLCRKQLIATGDAQACELRLMNNQGAPFWVQLAMSAAVEADDAPVMRVVMIDIDERKLMQAAMEEREARYRAMVEWSPEAVAVQRDGILIYVNAAALKLFGATRAQQIVGKPALDRVHPDFHPLIQARVKAMIQDKVAAPMAEMVLLRLDGTPIEVEVQSIRTVFDCAPAFQSSLHDVSERARLGQLLQAKNSELENARALADTANQAKSDFLSSMSHELRTPLGTILGYAQLLDSGTPPPSATQKRSIGQILQAGWYLLELVNEVLDLATIEAGKISLVLEPVALAGILPECQDMVEPLADKRAVALGFPKPDPSIVVHADRIRVKQVLINLLSNAIKYNRTGGSVAVTCLAGAPGRIRICIADTGQGLAPEAVAQLFQPFNRLGQERGAEAGTGIGLVMCKRLVELMGGAIGAQSTPGEGSLFWIELNLATQTQIAVTTGRP